MADYDSKNALFGVISQTIAELTSATNAGAIIDMRGYDSVTWFINAGTITTGTFTLKMEEGEQPNLSDATVVETKYVVGDLPAISFTSSESDSLKRIGYVGKSTYARLSLLGASTPQGYFCVNAILGHASNEPTPEN